VSFHVTTQEVPVVVAGNGSMEPLFVEQPMQVRTHGTFQIRYYLSFTVLGATCSSNRFLVCNVHPTKDAT
jgi:hypothetical protein